MAITKRPPMSINAPKALAQGGLASRGQSPFEAAQSDPAAAKALDEWTKEPAERVADSIGAVAPAVTSAAAEKPAEPVSAPSVPETQADPVAAAVAASDDVDEEVQPMPTTRKAKPWAEKERELRRDKGARSPQHLRIDTEIYAKAWWLKGSTPGMTWDSLIDEALDKLVNKKLREMGYTP